MANENNLKSWKPGQSGNPAGKPKGAKHLSTRIQNILQDDKFEQKLSDGTVLKGAPIEMMLRVLIVKATQGDLRAFDLLCKYGYGNKVAVTHFQDQSPTLLVKFISSKGDVINLPENSSHVKYL